MCNMNLKELVTNLSSSDFSKTLVEVHTASDNDFTSKIIRVNPDDHSIIIDINKTISSTNFNVDLTFDSTKILIAATKNNNCTGNIIKLNDLNLTEIKRSKMEEAEDVEIRFSLKNTFLTDDDGGFELECNYSATQFGKTVYFNVDNAPTAEFLIESLNGSDTIATILSSDGKATDFQITNASRPSPNYIKVVINHD